MGDFTPHIQDLQRQINDLESTIEGMLSTHECLYKLLDTIIRQVHASSYEFNVSIFTRKAVDQALETWLA
jgi:hypothetical protein